MSRTFIDDDLMSWEAYASGGKYGLPDHPKIIFHCLSDPDRRARYVIQNGDNADAGETVRISPPDRLRELLRRSEALD